MLNPNRERTSKELEGAFIGTLLGDSYINNGNMFSCEQTSKNLIEYKRILLEQLTGRNINISVRQRKPAVVHNNKAESIFKPTYSTRARYELFKKLQKQFYISGTKQVSMSILNKLTDEGLALWLMDDGTMYYSPSNHTKYLRICTDSFDSFSINQIQQFFSERYNISSKVYMHNSGNNSVKKPRIQFNAANAQKIISIVYKFTLPEFYYKLDLHYAEKTLKSKRCLPEYVNAVSYMSQHSSPIDIGEDIV